MKLGEALIGQRIISDGQLQEALNAQLIYGGHLGTCLIEQGCISEKQLAGVLSKTFGVPAARVEWFLDIPRGVLDILPTALVQKHLAIPFRLEGTVLDVAMINPRDLMTIDALAFASGRRIKPWVAPEVRILQALDRYYDVPRRMRYISLARQLDEMRKGTESPEVVPHLVTGSAAPETRWIESDATVAAVAVCEPRRSAASAVMQAAPCTAPRYGEDPLDPLTSLLCRVAAPAKLGEVVLEHLAPQLPRSILFEVRSGAAVVWDSRGLKPGRKPTEKPSFSIIGEPLFGLLLGENHFRGPLPPEPRYRKLYETLGISPPNELILVPIYVEDRLVAILYGDDGEGMGIDEDTAMLCRIGKKVGLALNLIQVKNQIRSV